MNRIFIAVFQYRDTTIRYRRLYSRCEIWTERDAFLSRLGITIRETLSNDIDVLAYLVQKLPITSYIGQCVDHHDAIIDVAGKLFRNHLIDDREWALTPRGEN